MFRLPRFRRGGRPHLTTCRAALLVTFATLGTEVTPPSQPVTEKPAHISFLSVPDGATVRLNGRQLEGTTPIEFQEVQPGISIIEFQKEGFETLRVQQYWASGATARLDVMLVALPTPTVPPTATLRPTTTARPTQPKVEALPPAVRVEQAPAPKPTRTSRPAAVPTVAAAKPTVATTITVTLISQPPGASVIFNGKPLEGVTPMEKVALPAGRATIEFNLENHEHKIARRSWKAGTEETVTVDLAPLPARLSVITTPSGAIVKINGVTLEGHTPIEGASVPSGETQVIAELENHMPAVERRQLAPGTDTRIEIQMHPLDAVVRFESDPPGATIILNGAPLPAKAPAGPMPLPPQHARIEFQLEGHAPKVVERDWLPSGVDAIMVKLSANPGRVQFQSTPQWDSLTVDGAPVAVQPGDWLPLPAGLHRALAQQGSNAAETEFTVPPGGDAVATLNWANKRPAPTNYVELPAVKASLGDKRFAEANPEHSVDIAAFWISRREVTVDEYRQCVEAGRCEAPGSDAGCNWAAPDRGKHPINCVNATGAAAYAAWLSEREGLAYRLPTADEWERAARGSGDRALPWGDEPAGARCNICDKSCAIERFRDEAFNDSWPETAPAGSLAYCTSKEGVIDLVGNVAEWTRHGDSFQVRGGSWAQTGIFLDPALVVKQPAESRDSTIGFRLVVSSEGLPAAPPPEPSPTLPEPSPTPVETPTPADSPTAVPPQAAPPA